MALLMADAAPAPVSPMAAIPNPPNIKIAFNTMFVTLMTIAEYMNTFVWPIPLKNPR
jgi:hypothetical protein